MKTLLLTIAAGLVTVTILAGCGDTEPTPYVVVGDDESGSIDGFDDGFQEERIRIVEWVAQERGTLVADAIDGNAAARFKKRVEHTFAPADGLGGNPVLEDDDLDRQAEELTATLEPTLREGAQTPGTDILGFAVAAANAMPEGRPTTLVLLTDGRQNAPAVDPAPARGAGDGQGRDRRRGRAPRRCRVGGPVSRGHPRTDRRRRSLRWSGHDAGGAHRRGVLAGVLPRCRSSPRRLGSPVRGGSVMASKLLALGVLLMVAGVPVLAPLFAALSGPGAGIIQVLMLLALIRLAFAIVFRERDLPLFGRRKR